MTLRAVRSAAVGIAFSLGSLASAAGGAASLQIIPGPPGDYVWGAGDVSADGSTVIGLSGASVSSITRCFRWTQATGTQVIDNPISPNGASSRGVSGDGSVIVGYVFLPTTPGGTRMVRSVNGGAWTDLGVLPGSPAKTYAQANAVSRDGQVVVGFCGSLSFPTSTRWTSAGGVQSLGLLPGETSSHAGAVNADGSIIAGSSYNGNTGQNHAFIWKQAGGKVDIGVLPGNTTILAADVRAMNGAGTVLVGVSSDNSNVRAYKWTAATGMVQLPRPAAATASYAYAVSDDGDEVVGNVLVPNQRGMACRWTTGEGFQLLKTYLPTLGIDLTNLLLDDVLGLSADGLTIVGSGYSGSVRMGWMLKLPSIHRVCPADFNGDQFVDDADFITFAAQYDLLLCSTPQMPVCPADINADGMVDDADFVLFVMGYDGLMCP